MSDKVYVSIMGESVVGGESDKTELVTEGDYAFRGGKYLLKYKEGLADGDEFCSTVIKIDKDVITMTRTGTANTQMIFEHGKRHLSHYETPIGSFTIGITTDSMSVDIGEDGGDVKIKYILDINSVQSKNNLHLNIRKADFSAQA
jgi:uncharacterized beta-barrel protein YwiB (DUF1934 family)